MMSFNQASEDASSCSALFNRFQCFLYAEYHKGHHVILIVHEAQNVGKPRHPAPRLTVRYPHRSMASPCTAVGGVG
jgi:hypothetical protein